MHLTKVRISQSPARIATEMPAIASDLHKFFSKHLSQSPLVIPLVANTCGEFPMYILLLVYDYIIIQLGTRSILYHEL